MRDRRGILIAIEGIDGAGKTTQAALLRDRLTASGISVVSTKEPTKGPYGEKIRSTGQTGRLPVKEELALFIADRREHVRDLINPALERGDTVIVDRYYYSSAAYQGSRGLEWRDVMAQNEAFAPRPDLVVILALSPPDAMQRIIARGELGNHFERESDLAGCADVFAIINSAPIVRLDAMQSRETLHAQIVAAYDDGPFFRRHCLKDYLKRCEPEYCGFRIEGVCRYVPDFGSLRPAGAFAMADVQAIGESDLPDAEKIRRTVDLLDRAK